MKSYLSKKVADSSMYHLVYIKSRACQTFCSLAHRKIGLCHQIVFQLPS